MKLSKVSVKNLFGIFNHEIKVNNERGITIVIGENGLGKTVLLEMIESFFNSKFYYFNSISFEELIFEFEDEVTWVIKKEVNEKNGENLIIQQTDLPEDEGKFPIQISNFEPQNIQKYAIYLGRTLSFIKRTSPYQWVNVDTGDRYTAQSLVEKYGQELQFDNNRDDMVLTVDAPPWYQDKFEKMNVILIETQRVIVLEEPDQAPIETVRKYSRELSQLIKATLAESTELSSKLDRTYPNRLVRELKQRKTNVSDEDLNDRLSELEEKRRLMDVVGLMETEKDSNLLTVDRPEEVVKDVLMLYIKDSFEKLSIFDDISLKIELLLKIINNRFKHKKLFVNKETGFLFRSTVIKDKNNNYKFIPIEKLSSGEKNELILFYRLIFKTDSNSLILIDEPEISLHISWQNKFISDLNEIHKLNKLDILIATHSPDIIANNWDLMVELRGVE
jgi:predicted ATP-binding protein involved in virulence